VKNGISYNEAMKNKNLKDFDTEEEEEEKES